MDNKTNTNYAYDWEIRRGDVTSVRSRKGIAWDINPDPPSGRGIFRYYLLSDLSVLVDALENDGSPPRLHWIRQRASKFSVHPIDTRKLNPKLAKLYADLHQQLPNDRPLINLKGW